MVKQSRLFDILDGGFNIGLERKELIQPHQFHRLGDAGIAHNLQAAALVLHLLGDLHQCSQPGAVDEVNL